MKSLKNFLLLDRIQMNFIKRFLRIRWQLILSFINFFYFSYLFFFRVNPEIIYQFDNSPAEHKFISLL